MHHRTHFNGCVPCFALYLYGVGQGRRKRDVFFLFTSYSFRGFESEKKKRTEIVFHTGGASTTKEFNWEIRLERVERVPRSESKNVDPSSRNA